MFINPSFLEINSGTFDDICNDLLIDTSDLRVRHVCDIGDEFLKSRVVADAGLTARSLCSSRTNGTFLNHFEARKRVFSLLAQR